MRTANRRHPAAARRRRGSVLILVVALLVLLALMGTAYLSSTSTERASSVQHSVNSQGDLARASLVDALAGQVVGGVFGRQPNTGASVYRPAEQEMPTYDGAYNLNGVAQTVVVGGTIGFRPPTGYAGVDSLATDLFLGNRVPSADTSGYTSPPAAVWGSPAWPLFPESDGAFKFGSPYTTATVALPAAYKPYVQFYPTTTTVNGTISPAAALLLNVPSAVSNLYPNAPAGTGFLTLTGALSPTMTGAAILPAVDTDGDGIADAVLFPLPGGPVAGVTYYGAYRALDANSAVNVSTALSSTNDYAPDGSATTVPNYGFFRSNVGLQEILTVDGTIYGGGTPASEIANLNSWRFNGATTVANPVPAVNGPVGDAQTARTDFSYFSAGDALEDQLARRGNNPGYRSTVSGNAFDWPGAVETANLAYRFSLQNVTTSPSLTEQYLYRDLLNRNGTITLNYRVPTAPYDPTHTTTMAGLSTSDWFANQFNYGPAAGGIVATNPLTNNMPLRPILTASSPISNAAPTHPGDALPPPTWPPVVSIVAAPTVYAFGDTVTYQDPVTKLSRVYTCILQHTYNANFIPGSTAGAPFWFAEPITQQTVKASVNTAPFNQLYLAYARAMTDSVGTDPNRSGGATLEPTAPLRPQWLPPMQPAIQTAPTEQQLPAFRSPIRLATAGIYTSRLAASQVLQLRAALMAANTIDLRDSDDTVTSHRITLIDPATGKPQYEAEVFGTEAQPFIGAVYAHVDATTPANNYLAIQLLNPYDHDILVDPGTGGTLGGWRIATMPRLGAAMTMTDQTASIGWTTPIRVPAKSISGVPGIAVIHSGNTPPTGYTTATTGAVTIPGGSPSAVTETTSVTDTTIPNLQGLLGIGELYLLKPRAQQITQVNTVYTAQGVPSLKFSATAGNYDETYNEKNNVYDLVPVDQVDVSNLGAVPAGGAPGQMTADFYYRRGSDPGTLAGWNFVYPGFYKGPAAGGAGPTATQMPQGFGSSTAAPTAMNPVNLATVYGYAPLAVGSPTGTHVTSDPLGNAQVAALSVQAPTYDTYPIVLNNTYMAGPNKLRNKALNTWYASPYDPSTPTFPYGGFARNGDILQVPFIGAYRLRNLDPVTGAVATGQANIIVEMNSVSEDSSLAIDPVIGTDGNGGAAFGSDVHGYPDDKVTDPYREQVGRCCPLGDTAHSAIPANPQANPPVAGAAYASYTYDFVPPTPNGTAQTPAAGGAFLKYHYHWGRRLFDNLTVTAPSDDYLPNIDPSPQDTTVTPTIPAKDPNYTAGTVPSAVANRTAAVANATVAGKSEDTVGVEGLVNINTAPWPVIAAALPANLGEHISYTPASGATAGLASNTADTTDDRVEIAEAIVDDRNANGPFRSLFDLYRVQAFRLENDAMLLTEPGQAQGLFSPLGIGTNLNPSQLSGRPRFDFEERFLLMNRVSNLLTVRSDSFTCYTAVVGYRDAGSSTATLAVQRRSAFLLDRGNVTATNRNPETYAFPNQ